MTHDPADPVRAFGHSHGRLTELTIAIAELLRASNERARPLLQEKLGELRDELLEHFANEEEALFPFIRTNFPESIESVDRLESGHDAICGAVVRLAHVAMRSQGDAAALAVLYERFELAYAAHARDEGELFDRVERVVTEEQRGLLAGLLRGL